MLKQRENQQVEKDMKEKDWAGVEFKTPTLF